MIGDVLFSEIATREQRNPERPPPVRSNII